MNKVDEFFSCYLTYGIWFGWMQSTFSKEKEVHIRKEKENRNV